MTSSTQPKSTPIPALLVYGTPTSPELTQASWFRAEDTQAGKAAAVGLNFSVLELKTDADRAVTVGVHEGVLKGSGRMIVGSVTTEVYRRIEDYVRKAAGADASGRPANTAPAEAKSASEQTTNMSAAGTSTTSSAPATASSALPDSKPPGAANPVAASTSKPETPPNPWETLRVGARVLAAYWNEKREFEGFWLATVKRIDKGEFTLEWFQEPEYPAFKSRPKNIAVPHPESVSRASSAGCGFNPQRPGRPSGRPFYFRAPGDRHPSP
jgi:hypothetical protein